MRDRRSAMPQASAIMFFGGLCASSASVILPLLREQYVLDYDVAGLLLAFLSVGNLISALCCGLLPRFIGTKASAVLLSAGLCLGYALMAVTGQPMFLLMSFLLVGFGKAASLNNATVVGGAGGGDRTAKVNILNAFYAGGSLCAPLLYLLFAGRGMWKLPLMALSGAGVIVWIIFLFLDLPKGRKESAESNKMDFLKEKHFWFAAAFLFGQQCAENSVTGWVVTYFKDAGILSGIFSELTVTVVWGAMLIGRLVIAFVLPKESKFRSLIGISAASFVTYVLLLCSKNGALALLCLFLFGLAVAGAYPTGIAQANKNMSNASVGVLLPVAGIGSIVMPYVIGLIAEQWGIFAGMICPAAAFLWMLVFAVLMKKYD